MNKRELIEEIVGRLGDDTSRRSVESTVDALLDTVGDTLRRGEKVSITGFGSFEARKRGARTARNPQTGEPVKVKATTVPAFKAGQGLKETVSGARKATGKKATAKKAAGTKSTAKKATANKSTANKSTAKKATAKKAAAKKATAKKATAKKAAAKTATGKSTAKKAGGSSAKKSTSKVTAKKATAKKAAGKKATAKRSGR